MISSNLPLNNTILALDVGDKRIGVARAHTLARLPEPIEPIANDELVFKNIKQIIQREDAGLIVIGIPRNLKGEETAQSQKIRAFSAQLVEETGQKAVFVDESMSSKRADEYLYTHKKIVASQDSVAACFILEEYFGSREKDL